MSSSFQVLHRVGTGALSSLQLQRKREISRWSSEIAANICCSPTPLKRAKVLGAWIISN